MYVLGVAAFCLLLSIDFLALWAEYLIEYQVPLATVARLVAYKFPWFLHLSLPVSVIVAILLATGRLGRDSELKAMYGLGMQPMALLVPLLLLGVVVSGITFVNNGYLEPEGEERYNALVDSFFYTRPPNEVQSNVAYSLPDQGIYFASRVRSRPSQPDAAELSGVLVLLPDGTTLSATSGIWDSGDREWILHDAQRSEPGATPEEVGRVVVPFELETDAGQALTRRETLSLPELTEQIGAAREAGGNTRELEFQLHRRIADAFSALVFALFAGTLGLGIHGRASAITWSIVLLVLFWATWTLSGNLFETRVLGAVAAAWLTPLAVGVAGFAFASWRLRS